MSRTRSAGCRRRVARREHRGETRNRRTEAAYGHGPYVRQVRAGRRAEATDPRCRVSRRGRVTSTKLHCPPRRVHNASATLFVQSRYAVFVLSGHQAADHARRIRRSQSAACPHETGHAAWAWPWVRSASETARRAVSPLTALASPIGSGATRVGGLLMVPLAGLEPACLAAFDFESNASTNFATGAAKMRPVADETAHGKRYTSAISRGGRPASIAQRFRDMQARHRIAAGEIGDGPRHAEDPRVTARRHASRFGRLRQ